MKRRIEITSCVVAEFGPNTGELFDKSLRARVIMRARSGANKWAVPRTALCSLRLVSSGDLFRKLSSSGSSSYSYSTTRGSLDRMIFSCIASLVGQSPSRGRYRTSSIARMIRNAVGMSSCGGATSVRGPVASSVESCFLVSRFMWTRNTGSISTHLGASNIVVLTFHVTSRIGRGKNSASLPVSTETELWVITRPR